MKFSWLKPIILNKNKGKQKTIKIEILIVILILNKSNKQYIKKSQILFNNKVE